MLAICSATELVVFKAPKTSFNAERVPQGAKPGAKPGHKKHSTSSNTLCILIEEATKGGSSKATTDSKTGHSKKRKESSSAIDSNPSQPPVSTPVDTRIHKEDQQVTGGPTSLGVTISIAEANPSGISDPSDFVLSTQVEEEETSSTIKLEDLEKLVSNMQPSFKDLDSPEIIMLCCDDSDKDEEDEVHPTTNAETEDTLVPKSSSLGYSQIQELTNQVLTLQSQKHKLEREKIKAKAKILSAHDFSSSLLTELKDLPSKFNELTREVKGLKKQVHELEIKLPGELKGNPTKLGTFTKIAPFLHLNLPKSSSQPEGEHIKKDKVKKAMSSEEAEKDSTNSDSNDETHVTGFMVESSKTKKLKKLHQGPGLDDHARTFSSLLLAEIDKRNLNTLKQMRVIEQLRQ
ncbi:hypothetical protein Tco_0405412 [Tanacetum coccineum]